MLINWCKLHKNICICMHCVKKILQSFDIITIYLKKVKSSLCGVSEFLRK